MATRVLRGKKKHMSTGIPCKCDTLPHIRTLTNNIELGLYLNIHIIDIVQSPYVSSTVLMNKTF